MIPDQLMVFGGSAEPCAVCTLGNVGRLNNKDVSKAAMEKINDALKIPTDRLVIYLPHNIMQTFVKTMRTVTMVVAMQKMQMVCHQNILTFSKFSRLLNICDRSVVIC